MAFLGRSIPSFTPQSLRVTKLLCTKDRALDRFDHTIAILRALVLYWYGYFVTGFSGISMGGKGLRDPHPVPVVYRSEVNRRLQSYCS